MADLPDGFDLEALLAPIPGDAPQGTDIREDFSSDRLARVRFLTLPACPVAFAQQDRRR